MGKLEEGTTIKKRKGTKGDRDRVSMKKVLKFPQFPLTRATHPSSSSSSTY